MTDPLQTLVEVAHASGRMDERWRIVSIIDRECAKNCRCEFVEQGYHDAACRRAAEEAYSKRVIDAVFAQD